jgi:hypothetical protein
MEQGTIATWLIVNLFRSTIESNTNGGVKFAIFIKLVYMAKNNNKTILHIIPHINVRGY